MFDRFTDAARKVMGLARLEAQSLEHQYIGTEHILLGLLLEGESPAAAVLRELGADVARVRAEIEKIVQRGPRVTSLGQMPFTPRAKGSLEEAFETSRRLGHLELGPAHLLLGLVENEEAVAVQVLRNLGLQPGRIRDAIHAGLAEAACGERSPAPATSPHGLTQDAERTLALARAEATRLGHDQVGTEHLFLAILQQADAVPAKVLEDRGLKLASLRAEVLGLLGGA